MKDDEREKMKIDYMNGEWNWILDRFYWNELAWSYLKFIKEEKRIKVFLEIERLNRYQLSFDLGNAKAYSK